MEGPTLPALHLAAQQGDLDALYRLLDSPPDRTAESTLTTASDVDEQGITALHWAAINAHLLCCKALLERGAEVDARGGELAATPLMWAARQGHLAVVHLLLKYGADPSLTDSQQFNCLHLSVHSSSAFLVAYLLNSLQPLAVDQADPDGHSALAWACYQGDAVSVELLLRAGADVRRPDHAGLTALHWAVTKGNATCIRRCVQAGANLAARTHDGKTAREMAAELKSLPAYERALQDAGLDPRDGTPEDLPFRNPRRANLAIFLVVAAAFGALFETVALLPWYTSLILVATEAYAMHHLVARVILGVRPASAARKHGEPGHGHAHGHVHGHGSERVTKSGYLCAVITASLFWTCYVWLTRIVLQLSGYSITSLLFALLFLSCCYNFFRAITLDPGTVRGPRGGTEELKEVIEEMVESGTFNGINFCLTCMVRRPLRSKHSYATDRCVAKFDHYCPWVWNDVGVNNHRQFLLFVASLVFGVLLFVRLTWAYFYEKAPDLAPDAYCPALVPTLICTATTYDPFAFAVAMWASLQLTWTVILLAAQLWQVARQMTTLEVSNVGRYGYMGGKPGLASTSQFGATAAVAVLPSSSSSSSSGLATPGGGDDPASLAHAPRPPTSKKGTFDYLLKLLGLDRFTSRGKAISGLAHATRGDVVNPFDLGVRSNCVDFWTRGQELGVEYERLYEIPAAGQGGFRRLVAERKRRAREDKARGGTTGPVSLPGGGGASSPAPPDVGLAGLLAGMKRKMRPYDRVRTDDLPV